MRDVRLYHISLLTFGDKNVNMNISLSGVNFDCFVAFSLPSQQHDISPSGGCVQASVEKASTFCRESIQIALLLIQNEMSLFYFMQCLKVICFDKV